MTNLTETIKTNLLAKLAALPDPGDEVAFFAEARVAQVGTHRFGDALPAGTVVLSRKVADDHVMVATVRQGKLIVAEANLNAMPVLV